MEYTKKKKLCKNVKKNLLVLVATVLLIMCGAGAAYAYSYVQNDVIPKQQLAKAIEQEFDGIASNVDVKLNQLTSVQTTEGRTYSGEILLNELQAEDIDQLQEYSVNQILFSVDVNQKQNTIEGTIHFQNQESGESKLDLSFYTDGTTVTCHAPQLSDDTMEFYLSSMEYQEEMQYAYKAMIMALTETGSAHLDQYTASIQAGVEDVLSGLKQIFEESDVERTGTGKLQSDVGEQSVSYYQITITPQAINTGLHTILDTVYSDKELSSYTTLIATYTGMSKLELTEYCDSYTQKLQNIPVTMCITDDNEILSVDIQIDQPQIGLIMDLSAGYVSDHYITDEFMIGYNIEQITMLTDELEEYDSDLSFSEVRSYANFRMSNHSFIMEEFTASGTFQKETFYMNLEGTVSY